MQTPTEKEQAMQEMMAARQKREKSQRIGKGIVATIATMNMIPSAIMVLLVIAAGIVALFGLVFTLGDGLASFSDSILGGAQTALYFGRRLVYGDTSAVASDYVVATAAGAAISNFIITVIIVVLLLPAPIVLSIALYRGHGWARLVLMIFYFSAFYVLIFMGLQHLGQDTVTIILPVVFGAYSLVTGVVLSFSKSVKVYMEYAINN